MVISNRELLDRVVDRYDVYELVEALSLAEHIDEDILDADIEDFVKVYRTTIIRKQKELDVW